MSDQKQVTPEELQQLMEIRRKYDELSFQYGKIEFAIDALAKEQKRLKEEWTELNDGEEALLTALQEKYGGGSINLETGEVIQEE